MCHANLWNRTKAEFQPAILLFITQFRQMRPRYNALNIVNELKILGNSIRSISSKLYYGKCILVIMKQVMQILSTQYI